MSPSRLLPYAYGSLGVMIARYWLQLPPAPGIVVGVALGIAMLCMDGWLGPRRTQ